ncbi:MAG: type II secretion system F family protein, partial [Silicimonas sp.]|nr:type II secretion system F family protein [Silicimonas sp.]
GMPVTQALAKLEDRPEAPVLGAGAAATRRGVEQGQTLDEAMATGATVFPPIVIATIRAGMLSGRLDQALTHLIDHLGQQAKLERKVRRAATYPLFLLGLLAVVVAVLMLFVLCPSSGILGQMAA